MPPPHHYRVGATIQPDGSGTATMTPGYPGAHVPTWSLRFQLDAEDLDALYTVLRVEGLFSPDWHEPPGPPPVGGSVWSLTATANSQEVSVSGQMTSSDGARPKPLRDAVWNAVPKRLRTALAIRRKAYAAIYRATHP